ncbi:MAG: AAA family ATPase [Candidatus Hodarchaeales archaeon]
MVKSKKTNSVKTKVEKSKQTVKITEERKEKPTTEVIREPAEIKFAMEIEALKEADKDNARPENWELSPKMVLKYILGDSRPIVMEKDGKKKEITITRKFYGEKHVVERALVTLASDRGLLLVGEPGTGKSWLSEHLAAAISGDSTHIIQGTAGTTEDQIKYSWNIALLIAEGQSKKCLIPSPTMLAMEKGHILRFEEITRCTSDVQDSMVSIMSEKSIAIPELPEEPLVFAKKGFNVIATANLRDKGVNELSAALKRRFNYVTIPILQDMKTEVNLVKQRTKELLTSSSFDVELPDDVVTILCQTFNELRKGVSHEGVRFNSPKTVMSTAEEIAVLYDAAIYSDFFGSNKNDKVVDLKHLARTFKGSVVKEDQDDLEALKEYWNLVLKSRASKEAKWKTLYSEGKKYL